MKILKTIWKFLNGNKTIITGSLLAMLQLQFVKRNIPAPTLEVLNWGLGALAALSAGHHISKGYFTTKVGNQGQIMDDPLKEPKLKNSNVQK